VRVALVARIARGERRRKFAHQTAQNPPFLTHSAFDSLSEINPSAASTGSRWARSLASRRTLFRLAAEHKNA
jgi:hypothetical protein